MINFFKGLQHPEAFHGTDARSPYFEGWYHKLVSKTKRSIVIIPGMYRSGEEQNEFAFIMIFDGNSGDVHFERFPIDNFVSQTTAYNTGIEKNHFSKDKIILDIKSESFSIRGFVNFSGTTPWPVTLLEPGCMGWYSYLPIMECYHGILSMNHNLYGELNMNGENLNFDGGIGYIEKDWGRNFPQSWIWAQANHFKKENVSLSASIAKIPLLGTRFAGFIVGLLIGDKLYRFTTYKSAKIVNIKKKSDKIEWVLKQRDLTLSIFIIIGKKSGMLYAPDKYDMVEKVEEHLDSSIKIKLQKHQEIILEDQSNHAATEVVGDIESLLELANSA